MRTTRWAATALAAAATALSACGGDEATSGNGGPATAVPAQGALLYAEVQIEPGEDRAKEIKEALRKVARRDDVLDLLVAEIDKSMREDGGKLNFKTDIQPFLGKRAGLFFSSFSGQEPTGALIVEVDDEDAARKAIDKDREPSDKDATHQGVEYLVDGDDGDALALTGGLLIAGDEPDVKKSISALKGASLAKAKDYESALDPLEDDRLGHVWVDLPAVVEAISGFLTKLDASSAGSLDEAKKQIEKSGERGMAIGFDVDSDGLTIDFAARKATLQKLGAITGASGAEQAEIFEQLPAGAWLAFGASDIAQSMREAFKNPAVLGAGAGTSLPEIQRVVREATGLEFNAELFAPIDELAFYMSGTSLFSLSGGFLFKANDTQKLLETLKKAADALAQATGSTLEDTGGGGFEFQIPDTPLQIAAGAKDDRVALALTKAGVNSLLDPDKKLGDDDAYKAAKADLGDGYNVGFYVLVKPIVELLSSFGENLGPDFERARPYIETFEHLTIGSKEDGDRITLRIAVGLK